MELVAPAGDYEKLRIAVEYGADAVYLSGKDFGLRAHSGNFTPDEIKLGVELAHRNDVKVYATLNVFARSNELNSILETAKFYQESGIDALIVSDPGVFFTLQEAEVRIPIHLSTQANTVNYQAARFWRKQGICRAVLGRELSLNEIKEIAFRSGIDVEVFVHGAMCMAYSGRCLLSMYLSNRDANAGKCSQPCRWSYQLIEKKNPDYPLDIEEDHRGTYIMNSKDLCLLKRLPELKKAGVKALKIEGRMRSIYYLAVVVSVYRQALDRLLDDPENFSCQESWLNELSSVSHRGYTEAFFQEGQVSAESMEYFSSGYIRNYDFLGKVIEYDAVSKTALIEQRGNFRIGQDIQFIGPGGKVIDYQVKEIRDKRTGEAMEVARHPQQQLIMPVESVAANWLLRRKNND